MTNLSPKQLKAGPLIVAGESHKKVAEIVGVTPETISHWMANPYFEAYVNQLQHQMMDELLETLRRAGKKAATTLEDTIENGKSESSKLKACIAVLQFLNSYDHVKLGSVRAQIGLTDPVKIENNKELQKNDAKSSDKLANIMKNF